MTEGIGIPFVATDIAIVAILVLSGLLAYFRGFVREILSLGTWLGAAVAAYFGYPYLQPVARRYIGGELVADIAAGVGLFVATLIVLMVVNHAISGRVKDSALSELDRALGFAFGLARGGVIVCLLYIAATSIWSEEEMPGFLREARAAPVVREGATILRNLVPDPTRRRADAAAKSARDTTEAAIEAERLWQSLNDPKPTPDTGTPPDGYKTNERRELQRLIDSSQ